MSTKEKKNKKHQQTVNALLGRSSVVPPKKSKNQKKRKGTRRERSSTKLHASSSNASLGPSDSRHLLGSFLPSIAPSETNLNTFNDQGSTTPPKPKGTTANSPPKASPTVMMPVKWKSEEVAIEYIQKLDATMARLEYIEACSSTKIAEKDCQLWKKNLQKNQSDVYPIPDASLIKIASSPEDYVNMSSVTVPHCQFPILMAQIPKRGSEEEFWKAAFFEQCVMMYVLIGADDEKNDFFPVASGAFVYYGSMFVNNRKVEKMDEERTRYTIEVLPNGFSNSIMMNVYVHTGWEPQGVPLKFANTTRSVVDVMNFVKTSSASEKMMVVSRNGCGRAGFFLALGASFCCLNDGSEPRIVEIVKAIRLQRPNSVDSMKQYASIYLCLLYYIKKKITIPDSLKQKLEEVTKGLETLIKDDVTITY